MSENNQVLTNIQNMMTGENLQKYVLGTKKNGQPRAIYDVLKDIMIKNNGGKKKGKKHHKHNGSAYSLYVTTKKKGKGKNHWHI